METMYKDIIYMYLKCKGEKRDWTCNGIVLLYASEI